VRGRRALHRYGWRGLAVQSSARALRPLLAPLAARRLAARLACCASAEELVEIAFSFRAYGITLRPLQSRWELGRLLAELSALRPAAMLEIGTANGGTLLCCARACAPDARVISIDLPGGPFGGGYPRWKRPVYEAFVLPGQRLQLLRGDSHSPEMHRAVLELLGGRPLDFLFIDADHSYEGVRADFERYGPLVRRGGLIALHDIEPPRADSSPLNDPGEVPSFWAELASRLDAEAIVDPNGSGCFGIGLVRAR
jgi:predicted O-methyltransferase YrrM